MADRGRTDARARGAAAEERRAEAAFGQPRSAGPAPEDVRPLTLEGLGERGEAITTGDVEALLAHAVKLLLRGGFRARLHREGFPELEVVLTEDTLTLNLRHLDDAFAWQLDGGEDVAAKQILTYWRVFLNVEDAPVAALGRGIPGVQVRSGQASYVLFKDFLKGLIAERSRHGAEPPAGAPASFREERRRLRERHR